MDVALLGAYKTANLMAGKLLKEVAGNLLCCKSKSSACLPVIRLACFDSGGCRTENNLSSARVSNYVELVGVLVEAC